MSTDNNGMLQLKLKSGKEKRVLGGHPWVFSNELERVPADAEPGTLAVLEAQKGRTLGIGYFNPKSLISFRLVSRTREEINASFFRQRLERARNYRERCLSGAHSYRLCYGESDGLPGLIVDKYEDILTVETLTAGMERLLPQIVEALIGLFEPRGIQFKGGSPLRKMEGLPAGDRTLEGEVPERVKIEEAGLKYVVTPAAEHRPAFHFDQRENRAALVPYCRGRRVLDFHCYSGAFALTAAKHGAVQAYGLDSSEEAIALAKESAGLNGLGEKCSFDVGDAEEVLSSMGGKKQSFTPDLIILDPPALPTSKKNLGKTLRAYSHLNGLAMASLRSGGLLATSTSMHHITRETFVGMLHAAASQVGRRARIIEQRGQAKDHPVLLGVPETEYLHFAVLEVD